MSRTGPQLRAWTASAPAAELRRGERPRWAARLAAGCALCLCALAGARAAAPGNTEEVFWLDAPGGPSHGMPGSLAELVAPLEAAVVSLAVERSDASRSDPMLGVRRRGRELTEVLGSGFILSRDGYALTAEALVANARRIRAQLSDGRSAIAQLVGRDSRSRLALLKLEGPGPFVPAPLGDSDAASIGDWVIAIGQSDERTPESDLGADHSPTLAKGIISGRERRVENSLAKLIQTDLVLVDGYTGAPLIDMNGRVIGVVDRELQPEGSLGISFAIPIREAKRVLGQLRSAGRVRHGWLGVQITKWTPALVTRMGVESSRGALVSDVLADTPAQKAKIQPGDVIVEFAGSRIEESDDLPSAVAALKPGTEVAVVVLRHGKRRSLAAVLGAQPEEPIPPQEPPAQTDRSGPWGFEAELLTPELARRYGLAPGAVGLVVTSVDPLSPADRAELAPGDLLREANGERLQTQAQLEAVLKTREPLLRVQRGPTTLYRVLERDRD